MTKGKLKLRALALVLTACMVLTFLPAAGRAVNASSELEFTKVDSQILPESAVRSGMEAEEQTQQDVPADDEEVPVIIILEESSVIDRGYSTLGLADNAAALAYSDRLLTNQTSALTRIEKQVFGGQELDVRYRFTIGVNGIAATVPYGKVEQIAAVKGVKEVYVETQYELDGTVEPDTATSGEMVGSYSAWADGYTGAGSRIAIIDTGIDRDHPSFSEEGFRYGLALSAAKFGKDISDYNLLTAEEVAQVLPRLHVTQILEEKNQTVTAEDLYTNEKIPFGFNYQAQTIEYGNDSVSGDHGCHVAGIAAANTYIPHTDADGDVYYAPQDNGVTGIAPNAQILVMKVFSDGWGASESNYMAAIEDAILLGCDSVNLSLGSTSAGRSYTTTFAKLFDSLLSSDTVITMSAGNNGAWSDNNLTGTGLNLTTDVRMHTGGSPGSYTNSFTIASVTNIGLTGIVGGYNGVNVVANDTGAQYNADTFDMLDTSADGSGTQYEYVFLGDPVAKTGIYGEEADFEGQDFTGKVVLISRGGGVSFFEKANRAVEAGAVATVIYNNVDGSINMNLTGYTYTAPAVSISKADGDAILAASTQDDSGVWGGKVTVSSKPQTVTNEADGYKPSSFTSWGVTENLALKPEIIAPGGNIYSTLDGGTYGLNSGTSMSAPSVTGSAAVVAQYIKENNLTEKTGLNVRTLSIALLMSTAKPLTDDATGLPYSPRLQGSGLSQVYEAVTSPAYLLAGETEGNDGKVKLELGDDPDRTGVYTGTFSVNNLTGEDLTYSLDSIFSTMDVEVHDGQEYMSKSSYRLNPTVTFETGAKPVYTYDLNQDGKVDRLDATALLKAANGTAPALAGLDAGLYDFDADGRITTTDAQLFLAALKGDKSHLDAASCAYQVPANGSIQVKATIRLSQADKDFFAAHYPNGCYVDGYLYVNSVSGDSKQLSVPVLAYYGNWSEPSVYDKYVLLGDEYDETACGYVKEGFENFLVYRVKGSTTSFYYSCNNYATDDAYIPDRNAFANTSTLYQAVPTFIRNVDNVTYTISNADTGEVYFVKDAGSATGAYYSTSNAAWGATSTNHGLSWYVTNAEGQKLPEGTRVAVTARAATEYNWDRTNNQVVGELADGAYWTTTFTIDNTAPEATSIALTTDAVTGGRSLAVTALDNRYTAAVLVLSTEGQVLARSAVNQTELGAEATVHVDLTQIYTNHFLVALYDYAANYTVYEVSFGGQVDIPEANTILSAALPNDAGQWFADIDADDLSAITTKNAQAGTIPLLSVARGGDNTLYAASQEQDAEGKLISSLYTVNEADYSLTKIGTSEVGYPDMSWAPTTNGGAMIAAYGPYALVVDTATGGYLGAWNLSSYIGSSNYAVGMAYVQTQEHATYGSVDLFVMLCSDGTLYQTGFAYDTAKQQYVIFTPSALAKISGLAANTIAGSSLYAQDGKLFISALTETGSKLMYVDLTASSSWIFDLGTIGTAPVSIYGATVKTADSESQAAVNLEPIGDAVEAQSPDTVVPQMDR